MKTLVKLKEPRSELEVNQLAFLENRLNESELNLKKSFE